MSSLTPTQRAVLEREGTEADEALLGESPSLSADEPVIFDLYLRLRRATASDQPVSIDQALMLHRIYIGEPFDTVAFLEEIDAMEAEFSGIRSSEAERRRAQAERREKASKASGRA